MAEEALFIYSGGNREGNYLRWRFFLLFFFVSYRKDKMRAWLGTATAGQKGQTRGPASAREAEVRQEAKDAASCFFTDLWRLNGDRPRGAPSMNTWRGYEHASYWLLRMCRHMTSPATPPWRRAKACSP
jgi:hypothetical protein